MKRLQALYSTTIGKKFIAAITGLALIGFLVGHMAGNLKVFTGTTSEGIPHIDEYAHFLRTAGSPILPEQMALWGARLGLLVAFVLHVVVVVQLAMLSQEARPVDYVRSRKRAASLPALYMMFSGLLVLGFVVFHILHFTTGTIVIGSHEHGLVYKNLFSSFGNPIVALGYVAVVILFGFHLNHGVWSLFQTLGLDNPDRNQLLRMVATGLTVVIVLGFIAVPLSFMSQQMAPPVDYDHSLLTGGH